MAKDVPDESDMSKNAFNVTDYQQYNS